MQKHADGVRAAYATLIGAGADEIAFLYATSEGENIVARGLGLAAGDNVVVDELHYNTTFVLYRELERTAGIQLRIVKARDGAVHVDGRRPRRRSPHAAGVGGLGVAPERLPPRPAAAGRSGARARRLPLRRRGAGGRHVPDRRARRPAWTSWPPAPTSGCSAASAWRRSTSAARLLDRIPLDRYGALHVERELGDHRYEIYQIGQAVRLRDAGLRPHLPARRRAGVPARGRASRRSSSTRWPWPIA